MTNLQALIRVAKNLEKTGKPRSARLVWGAIEEIREHRKSTLFDPFKSGL